MKRRIALWTLVGCAVACGWAVVALAAGPSFGLWNQHFLRILIEITCPVAVLGKFVPLNFYAVIAINGATYAAMGLAIEALRHVWSGPRTA